MVEDETLDLIRVARKTLELLRNSSNEEKAISYQRYFKEPVPFYGLTTPVVRQIKQDLLGRVKTSDQ